MLEITVHTAAGEARHALAPGRPGVVGRLPSCDVPIAVSDVSREHCRLEPIEGGGWRAVDLGSKNGITLEGKRVREARLAAGMVLHLGPEVRLEVRSTGEAPAGGAPKVEAALLAAIAEEERARTARARAQAHGAPATGSGASSQPSAGADVAAGTGAGVPAGGAAKESGGSAGAKGDAAPSEKPPGSPGAPATESGERPADETPAERARRAQKERARDEKRRSNLVVLGLVACLAAMGYGSYAYVLPMIAQKPVAAPSPEGFDVATAPSVTPLPPGVTEDEREWGRLEGLELDPELLASAFDAFARRYPASAHARDAERRAQSLRKVQAGALAPPSTSGTSGIRGARRESGASGESASSAGGPVSAAQGALEAEVQDLLTRQQFALAHYLASVAARLGLGERTACERLRARVEGLAYESFSKTRDRSRELVKEGTPLIAYERLLEAMAYALRMPFAKEAQEELASLKTAVERALEAGSPLAATGGAGDRAQLEKLVPEGKRAAIACDFDTALERYRQVLLLPLTEPERVAFQWRVYDLKRARDLFREVLLKVAETNTGNGGKRIQVTITQSIKGEIVEADVLSMTARLTIAGETSKAEQLWKRAWKDMPPQQVIEVFRGLDMTGDDLLALAAYCFDVDFEQDAHDALSECWERFPAWHGEAASLLRRHGGAQVSPQELVVFESRLISKEEREKTLKARAEAKAEAERIKRELAAAKKDETGKGFLARANAFIEAGMYVEGRAALVEIARRFKDVEVGKQARARWEDPFLRRRAQKVTGRDANRFSIYAMAEGFTVEKDEEQVAFDRFADRQKTILEKADFWKEYAGYMNYYAMNLWSKEKGVDREPGGVKKDTPLGGQVNQGVFTIQNGLVREYLARFPGPSVGVAIGNDNASVATGGGGACAIVKGMIDVAGHEIGHAFGGLGDEYDIDPSGPTGGTGRSKTPLPSVVLDANLIGGNQREELRRIAPWAHWFELGANNWTKKTVDIFEGGNRTPFDVWRPQQDCRMRTSTSPFCCVCMEQMVLHLYAVVRPIDEIEPKEPQVEGSGKDGVVLKATCLRPASRPLDAVWEIFEAGDVDSPDGSTVIRERKGKRLENVKMVELPDGRALYGAKVTGSAGLYDVVLKISDPTPWVQVKDRSALSEERRWRLKLTAK